MAKEGTYSFLLQQTHEANNMHENYRQERYLRMPELRKKLGGIGRSTVWRWVRDGRLPQPIRLGGRFSVWPEDAIDAVLKKQATQADVAN